MDVTITILSTLQNNPNSQESNGQKTYKIFNGLVYSQQSFFTKAKTWKKNETAIKVNFQVVYLLAKHRLPFAAQLFTQGINAKSEVTKQLAWMNN